MPSAATSLPKRVFGIPDASRRLAATRIALGLVLLVLLGLGPYPNMYVQEHDTYLGRMTGGPAMLAALTRDAFPAIRWCTMLGAGALVLGLRPRVAAAVCLALFGALSWYVSCFAGLWNYNTHLEFFLLALVLHPGSLEPNGDRAEHASAALFGMQAIVAILYGQAGLSKLIYGGVEWALGGNTVFTYTYLIGTSLGHALLPYRQLFVGMASAALLFELALPMLLLSRRTQRVGGVLAVALHVGIGAIMGIWFWHLAALLPTLFVLRFRAVKSPQAQGA